MHIMTKNQLVKRKSIPCDHLPLISGYLQVLVKINPGGHFLHIHEEYDFREHRLEVKGYSYNLLDKSKHNIIRADSLPYH